MPSLSAVLLNCTRLSSRAAAEVDTLLRPAVEWYERLGVTCELVRVGDVTGDDDVRAQVLAQVATADIVVVAAPRDEADRLGVTGLLEQLTFAAAPQSPLDGKVGCIVLVGAADGTDSFVAATLLQLSNMGAVLPPAAVGTEQSVESMALSTVDLATLLSQRSDAPGDAARPRKLFGSLPTGSLGIDPAVAEAEKLAAEQDRLVDRRRLLDLTRRDKGLPENRTLPRPPFSTGPDPRAE